MYECSHCIICDEGAAASACISRSQPETRKVHWKHAHLHHIQRARATAKISNAAPTAAGNPAPFRSMIYSGDERRFFFPPHKIWHVSQPLGITVTSHIQVWCAEMRVQQQQPGSPMCLPAVETCHNGCDLHGGLHQAVSYLYAVLAHGADPRGKGRLVAVDVTGHRRASRVTLYQMPQRSCFRSSSRSSLQSGSLSYIYGYHRHRTAGTSLRPGAGALHSKRSGGDPDVEAPHGLSRGAGTMRARMQSLACRSVLNQL